MNDAPRPSAPLVQFKHDLARLKEAGELDMLPANVSFDAFRNAAVVAITDNPSILQCSKESVFKSIRKLAAAGLVPDGREAAIVPYKGQATAMPMVYGLLKVARNSGEIASIWAEVVHEGEDFRMSVVEGKRKFSHDYDPLRRAGKITGAYAVATLKDGTVEIEPMGFEDIEKRRKASANQKGGEPTGIWGQWYAEMAKKTVIRALVKRLPMSSEDMRRVMVEDDDLQPRDVTPPEAPTRERVNLAQRLQNKPHSAEAMTGEVLPPEGEVGEAEASHWTDDIAWDEGFPGSDEFEAGADAFRDGSDYRDCPHENDAGKATDWLAGWHGARRASE